MRAIEDGVEQSHRARFVFFGSGYYSHDQGYTPDFPGLETFAGILVHPQFWPEDLDYAGEAVVVIGSGATAITLVPALARDAARVTMLQRSPTYIIRADGSGVYRAGSKSATAAHVSRGRQMERRAPGRHALARLP